MASHKNDKLARPTWGNVGRRELAFLGAPCGQIKQLAWALCKQLGPQWQLAYLDADHQSADKEAAEGRDNSLAIAHGASMEYTDKITFGRIDYATQPNSFQQRQLFQACDLVLVNGNHFEAQAQIAIVSTAKPLEKKLAKLTNVVLVLLTEGISEVPPYLAAHLAAQATPPPVMPLHAPEVAQWLAQYMAAHVPPLYGLVLSGGRSERMGRDKGLLAYHGLPQRDHARQLLAPYCAQVFASCRPDQAADFAPDTPLIPDTFADLGPLGGILSALRAKPDAAWLVVACDLPLLSERSLAALVAARQAQRIATTFQSPHDGLPEPLITIWEPKAYPVLLQFLGMGYGCPRKALINSDIHLLPPPFPQELANINTPDEYQALMQRKG